MSIKLHISSKWRELFQQNKLIQFEDFFKDNEIFVLVAEEKSTSVYKFSLAGSTFFLKRILPEHIKKVTRSLLKGKGFWNPVADEIRNTKHLEKSDLPLLKIAAWGIKKTMGFPCASFLISEEVDGEDFMELYDKSKPKIRQLMYKEYGRLMAQIHNQGLDTIIRPQDLFCKVSPDEKKLKITLIDREEGSTKKKTYTEDIISKEIALTFYKFIKRHERLCISLKDILTFSRSYLEYSRIIKINKKEFYYLLVKALAKIMAKRKSQQFVKNLLPRKTFINAQVQS